jgi:putative ABC transport system permease protein
VLKNYLRTAFRNLLRHKFYSAINIIGLAVGITSFLLIFLYVRHELSYDRYHEKADRTYRIAFSGNFGGGDLDFAGVGAATAEALMNDFPEVTSSVRIYTQNTDRHRVRHGEKTFVETRVAFADASLFDVFTIPLLEGSLHEALAQPNTLAISDKTARKYFGRADPLGKTLTFDDAADYTVTGVFREIPSNSHFHFDFFAALETLEESRDTRWLNNMSFRTYIVLAEQADPKALETKFPGMVEKYCASLLELMKGQGARLDYYLQPLTAIHLHSDLSDELEANGDIKTVTIFSAIAFFILVISCVNFMNLSTARSIQRAKEVGIRKVTGAFRSQLISQFLAESIVLGLLSLLAAMIIVQLVLPYFNGLDGKDLSVDFFIRGTSGPVALLAVIVFVGMLAGSYPAFILSAFSPIAVLKQKSPPGSRGRRMRGALVIFQFAVSAVLIVGTATVYKQMSFIQNKKLGFRKEQTLVIHDAYILKSRVESFKNELLQNPDIVAATVSGYLPVTSQRTPDVVSPEGTLRDRGAVVERWVVDYDYVKTMGMEIVKGRDFSREHSTDSTAVIVNEAAAEYFDWKKPIGKSIKKNDVTYRVIGVVRDFHYESLRDHISPLVFFAGSSTDFLSLRFKTENIASTLRWVEEKWNAFVPGQPFEYSFLDERFQGMYRAERQTRDIFGTFAALAIFIGCLGLFGLASFMAEQRTKEIGIRKVLGSSVPGIVFLLSKDFLKWVAAAFLLAVPVSYFAMTRWLADFAYRVHIGWDVFFVAGGTVLLISLLTVSTQSVRAALADPIDCLRYE